VRIAPGHAHAWLNRGHVLLALHRLDEAIASFERATDADPRQPRPWLALGEVLEKARRLPDALACYEKVVALDAGSADGWLKFGSVLQRLGRPDLALERLRQAARLAPDSPQVLGLAQALARVEAGRRAGALAAGARRRPGPRRHRPVADGRDAENRALGRLPELFDEVLRLRGRHGRFGHPHRPGPSGRQRRRPAAVQPGPRRRRKPGAAESAAPASHSRPGGACAWATCRPTCARTPSAT
jgi:tetratricopeptide (TPR) repeat protein